MIARHENIKVFCGKGEKRASGFFTAWAFARHRGGRAKLERKDFPSDRRSVSAREGLEWKVCAIPAGAWEYLLE